jgi:hypothetical protein
MIKTAQHKSIIFMDYRPLFFDELFAVRELTMKIIIMDSRFTLMHFCCFIVSSFGD